MNRHQLTASIALSTLCLGIVGGLTTIYVGRLSNNDDEVPPLPKPLVDFIVETRTKRNEKIVASCKDYACLKASVPLLNNARNLSISAGNQSVSPISEASERIIIANLRELMRVCEMRDAPHKDDDCWGSNVFGLSLEQLATMSPNIKVLTDSISKEVKRLSDIEREREKEEYERQQAEQREQARKEAERAEKERKQREYDRNFIEFTWTDPETGAQSGKAIIERSRIRKYRSIGNNDMAQVILKMFDEWGSSVTNPDTGHEFHEVRINCDIYESSPSVIIWGSRRYGMGGNMPKRLCAEAGYPNRS